MTNSTRLAAANRCRKNRRTTMRPAERSLAVNSRSTRLLPGPAGGAVPTVCTAPCSAESRSNVWFPITS